MMNTRKWTESRRAAEGGTDVSSLFVLPRKSTYVFLRIVWLRQRDPLNDFTPPILFPNGLRPVFIIIIVSGHTYITLIIKATANFLPVSVNSTVSLLNLQ